MQADDEDEIVLTLPFPPSVNHYWRHGINPAAVVKAVRAYKHGGLKAAVRVLSGAIMVYVSKEGKAYKSLVQQLVRLRFHRPTIDYEVAVLIEAWSPNKRRWDVDNRTKALQDALTAAGVWADDLLVRDSRIVDRGILPPGRVVVWIRRFSGN